MENHFKRNILVLIITSLLASTVLAAKYPRGCEVTGFGYNENYLILNDKGEQTFYLIQNLTKQKIELERHETRDVFMSPTLQTKLNPGKWAAFAADIEDLHFKCFTVDDEQTNLVNCNEVLDICQYPRVKFALSNMGNYWVSTNKPQSRVIKDAIAKGILLRW
jgi:hypothetical protein